MINIIIGICLIELLISISLLIYSSKIALISQKKVASKKIYQAKTIHLLNLLDSQKIPERVLQKEFIFANIPEQDWILASRNYFTQFTESHLEKMLSQLEENGFFNAVCKFLSQERTEKHRLLAIEVLGHSKTTATRKMLIKFTASRSPTEKTAALLALSKQHKKTFGICLHILKNSPELSWLFITHIFSQLSESVIAQAEALLKSQDTRIVLGTLGSLPDNIILQHYNLILDLIMNTHSEGIQKIGIDRIVRTKKSLPTDIIIHWIETAKNSRFLTVLDYVRSHPETHFLPPLLNRLTNLEEGMQFHFFSTFMSYGHIGIELLTQATGNIPALKEAVTAFLKEHHA